MRRSLRWFAVGIAIASASGATWAWRHFSPPTGPPTAVPDRDAHNWGRVRPGARLTTTFELANRGGAPLKLGAPKASCGCAKPVLDRTELPPGARLPIRVSFQAPTDPGPVRHSITIPTNDPARPSLEFSLFAEAWTGVRASPQAVDAGALRPGDVLERTIQLASPDGKPFRLGRVTADLAGLDCRPETSDVALAVHRDRVTIRAPGELGATRGQVHVVTDRSDAPFLAIPVSLRTIGPVSVNPPVLRIDRQEIGRVVRRTILVRADGPAARLELGDVRAVAPWELVESSARPQGRGGLLVEVALRFPDGDGSPAGGMELTLRTPAEVRYRVPLLIEGRLPPLPDPG